MLLSSKSSLVNISVPIVVVKSPVLCVAAADLSTYIKQVSTFCYKFYSIEIPPNMSDEQRRAAHMRMVGRIRQITATFIAVVTTLLSLIISSTPEPYHTSILSGQGWVEELLEGHPARIQCELGVSRDIFLELVAALESFGHGDSKYVKIEEQLAIFLYMSITGLTI